MKKDRVGKLTNDIAKEIRGLYNKDIRITKIHKMICEKYNIKIVKNAISQIVRNETFHDSEYYYTPVIITDMNLIRNIRNDYLSGMMKTKVVEKYGIDYGVIKHITRNSTFKDPIYQNQLENLKKEKV